MPKLLVSVVLVTVVFGFGSRAVALDRPDASILTQSTVIEEVPESGAEYLNDPTFRTDDTKVTESSLTAGGNDSNLGIWWGLGLIGICAVFALGTLIYRKVRGQRFERELHGVR